MVEYIEREAATNADSCGDGNRVKTHFAQIIVCGTSEKPYYNILYFDPTDRTYHVGFGSFCLDYVFKWLEEEFEIVEDAPAADVVEVRHELWVHDYNNVYGCTGCGERETMSHKKLKRFCPNCGARMDGE